MIGMQNLEKNNSKPLKPRKVSPDSERSPPQNAVAWAVLYSNGHSQSQNRRNVSPTTPITSFANPGRTTPHTSFANHSPTTPNTSFANPGAMANPDLSGASTPFSTSLAHQILSLQHLTLPLLILVCLLLAHHFLLLHSWLAHYQILLLDLLLLYLHQILLYN